MRCTEKFFPGNCIQPGKNGKLTAALEAAAKRASVLQTGRRMVKWRIPDTLRRRLTIARKQKQTEMMYKVSEMLNEGRMEEGKKPLPKEELDKIVQEFVETKLVSEATAQRSKAD